MDLTGKKFLVVGTGISGVAAVKLLSGIGAGKIVVLDGNTKLTDKAVREKIKADAEYDVIIGEFPEDKRKDIDIVVLSPGVPTDLPFVEKFAKAGIPVWGELELAYQCSAGKLYAITGTNGKTTTTALTGAIMREFYKKVYVVGNIGLPYTEYALEMDEDTVTVAEVSSFQLETINTFTPDVCAILNITPDHLNRHHTMQNYIDTKFKIAQNQAPEDVCVLNYEDHCLRDNASKVKSRVFWFSSRHNLPCGIWIDNEDIMYKEDKDSETIKICGIHDMKLLGIHNYENVMAAIAICVHAGVPIECIRKAVSEFEAVEHRIEFVKEVNKVKYYNDSKGTNPDAAIKAVQAMVTPTVLIGGGYDKQSEYDEWIDSFGDTVKCLVLFGATADKIEDTARKHGFDNIIRVNDLKEAVKVSSESAGEGEAVLLSPACASWDMFKSYEERGKLFKQYVYEL